MKRMHLVLCLILFLSGASCGSATPNSGYTFYEVIHRPDQLKLGDRVAVELKAGDRFRGAIVRVGKEGVTVETEGKGNQRVDWLNVRVMERVTEK